LIYDKTNATWEKQECEPTKDIVYAHNSYCITTAVDHQFRAESNLTIHQDRYPLEPIIRVYYADNMFIAQSETTLYIYKSFHLFNWSSAKEMIQYTIDIHKKRVENVTIFKNKIFVMCCSDFVINYQETRLSDLVIRFQ
jgi:hypothetical protein